MRKITMILILLVALTSFSFAGTITFKGESKTIPAKLQGNWTETAVSRNGGSTWIDGISIPVKITKTGFAVGNSKWTVYSVNMYTDEKGRSGFLLTTEESPEYFEFWFEDDDNVVLLIHKDRIEIARCILVR